MLLKSKQLSKKAKAGIDQRKIDLLESLKGDKGDQGIQGEKGLDGSNGLDGKQGKAGDTIVGDPGPRGPAGPRGQKGDKGEAIKGDKGEKGQDGRGISSVSIVGASLIIKYSDGSKVNVGRVVGQMGPRGIPGKTGGVFGDTTNNTTNITEEVLSPEDSANLAAISPAIEELIRNQQCQLNEVDKELKQIKLHLAVMTDEELAPGDEEI